jgi:hypothetical protein
VPVFPNEYRKVAQDTACRDPLRGEGQLEAAVFCACRLSDELPSGPLGAGRLAAHPEVSASERLAVIVEGTTLDDMGEYKRGQGERDAPLNHAFMVAPRTGPGRASENLY